MQKHALLPVVCRTSLLALCLLQFACQDRPDPAGEVRLSTISPFASFLDRSVSGPALVAFPGPGWLEGEGGWRLNDEATTIFVVREPNEIITFELEADELPPLRAFWNGAELPSTLVRLSSNLLRVEIPPSLQSAGTHELTLRLEDASTRVAVTSLRAHSSGFDTSFSPEERSVYSYLAGLTGYGVTGINTWDQLGGIAFVGPMDDLIPITSDRRVSFTLENGSFANADFIVTGGGSIVTTTVPPLGRTSIAFDVPPGTDSLQLGTRGAQGGLFLWGAPTMHPARKGSQPPIVLVTLDTTRKDALGPYGGAERLTPNLTAFARTATVYERAWSTSPWTLPSHASIFTGLYPGNHGAGVASRRLVSSHHTLAELLRNAGYDTAGYPGGLLCRVNSGLAQGFLTYRQPRDRSVPDAELTDLSLARLDSAGTAPLFLFVNYFGPHFPYVASEESLRRSGATRARNAKGRSREIDALLDGDGAAWNRLVDREIDVTAADREAIHRAYLAAISDTDAEVGRLFAALERRGMFDDALIIVVADHGELLGEGGFYSHTTRLDDEIVGIPLIIKWPGQTRGATESELVSLVDLFPTILSVAGLRAPSSDGLDLRLERDEIARREYVVSEEHDRPNHPLFESMKIAPDIARLQTREGFRLVTREGSRCHVRRWATWREVDCDTGDTGAAPDVPAFVARSMGDKRTGRPVLSEEQVRNLRALGYIR